MRWTALIKKMDFFVDFPLQFTASDSKFKVAKLKVELVQPETVLKPSRRVAFATKIYPCVLRCHYPLHCFSPPSFSAW